MCTCLHLLQSHVRLKFFTFYQIHLFINLNMSLSFQPIKEFTLDESEMIYDIDFNPKRSNIVSICTIEGDIHFIDLNSENNNSIMKLKKHHKGSPIRRAKFANGELMLSAARTIKLYDLDKGKVVRKFQNDHIKIYSLLVIDNYLFCIGDDEGNFKAWDYRVDRGVFMHLKECDDYISDLDVNQSKRIVVASSGEGTLSAFNIRAKRMETPQSELFDAGFQSVKFLEERSKVLVGAEDGAINIFNENEWGNISDRFPIRRNTSRGQGGCSVDNLQVLEDNVIAAGTSEGNLLAVNVLPNRILAKICTHNSSIETVCVNRETQTIISSNDNIMKVNKYKEKSENDVQDRGFFGDLVE